MCGIAGVYSFTGPRQELAHKIYRMTDLLRHRGPDDEGYLLVDTKGQKVRPAAGTDTVVEVRERTPLVTEIDDQDCDLAFGHRRFAIIDLSAGGHQPFVSEDRRLCGVFNGLIYNYKEVRQQLASRGVVFQTDSDTEVLWRAYAYWGDRCFEKLNGTWAVAIYDLERRELLLCRDRLGKRPIYYYHDSACFYFASEIKPLLREAGVSVRVNDRAVFEFLAGGRRDTDSTTFFLDIRSVPAGTVMRVTSNGKTSAARFWELPQCRERKPSVHTPAVAAEELRALLEDAVRIRLRADVPLGVELSGGLDSSSIAALASTLHPRPLDCYTVEFPQPQWNEEPFARRVATHFGLNYHVVRSPDQWFWSDAQKFVELHEEPFHSPNLHTQQSVWRLMHTAGIRVILYGAGGDELFAGYRKEYFYRYLTQLLKRGHLGRFLSNFVGFSELSPLEMAAKALRNSMGTDHSAAGLWQSVLGHRLKKFTRQAAGDGSVESQLYLNMVQLKMPYWLRSNDKNSLAIPVEVRAPLLDYRIVEFAFRLPVEWLIRGGWLKWILRKAMEDLLPAEITWRRRKMGYPFPLRDWLQESISMVRATIRQSDNPYIDKTLVEENLECWIQDHPELLWRILILELWHKRFVRQRDLSESSEIRKLHSCRNGTQSVILEGSFRGLAPTLQNGMPANAGIHIPR